MFLFVLIYNLTGCLFLFVYFVWLLVLFIYNVTLLVPPLANLPTAPTSACCSKVAKKRDENLMKSIAVSSKQNKNLGICLLTTWGTQNHQIPCSCYLKTRFFGGENLGVSWFWVLLVSGLWMFMLSFLDSRVYLLSISYYCGLWSKSYP